MQQLLYKVVSIAPMDTLCSLCNSTFSYAISFELSPSGVHLGKRETSHGIVWLLKVNTRSKLFDWRNGRDVDYCCWHWETRRGFHATPTPKKDPPPNYWPTFCRLVITRPFWQRSGTSSSEAIFKKSLQTLANDILTKLHNHKYIPILK